MNKRNLVLLTVVACLAVLAAGWFLLVSPEREAVAAVRDEAQSLEDTNDRTRLTIQELRDVEARLPQEQAELAELSAKVPSSAQLPTLLRQMQDIGQASAVTITALTPQAPVALPDVPGVQAINVSITVKGGYAQLTSYVSELESLDRAFLVNGLTVNGSTGSAETAGELTGTVTGRVLVRP